MQSLPPRRRPRRCPTLHPQVREDLLDHRLFWDGGDDLELAGAAVRAVVHVDVEHPPEKPGPTHQLPSSKPVVHQRPFWPSSDGRSSGPFALNLPVRAGLQFQKRGVCFVNPRPGFAEDADHACQRRLGARAHVQRLYRQATPLRCESPLLLSPTDRGLGRGRWRSCHR